MSASLSLSLALWLLVAALLACAGLCGLQALSTSVQISLLDLYTHVCPDNVLRARRGRWCVWRTCYRCYGGLFVVSAVACAGVALRWW